MKIIKSSQLNKARMTAHLVLAVVLLIAFVLVGIESRATTTSTQLDKFYENSMGHKISGHWNLDVGFETSEEGQDDAKAFKMTLGVAPKYSISQKLDIQLDAGLDFQSAREQSRFDQKADENGVFIREALINYSPVSFLNLKAGAISQSHIGSDLLISSKRSFPAVRQTISGGLGSLRISLVGQQAIPTSASFNTDRIEREKTPTFYTETLSLGYVGESFSADVSAAHYNFNDLPSKIAADSEFGGNTINGAGADSSFVFDFEGFLYASSAELKVSDEVSFGLSGEWLENTQAPQSFNRGQMTEVYTELKIKTVNLRPYYYSFFNESDTAPAAYGSGKLGLNNRVGEAIGLEFEFTQFGVRFIAEKLKIGTINKSLTQLDRDAFAVRLETVNVSF